MTDKMYGDFESVQEAALTLKQVLFDDFKRNYGRYPTQLELDMALKGSGLWAKGVRINIGKAQPS